MATIFIVDGDVSRDVDGTDRGIPTVTEGRREYYVFRDSEAAGEVVRKRWEDMAKNDKREFLAIMGEDRLVKWALGQSDSFGISSLEKFLDRIASVPEEDLASYDGHEREGKVNLPLADDLGIARDEDAKVDWVMLRKDLNEGDCDVFAFPDSWRNRVSEFDKDDINDWEDVRAAIETNEDNAFDDIRDSYRFMDVVAYRHN